MGADLTVEGPQITVRPSDLAAVDVRVPGDIQRRSLLAGGRLLPSQRPGPGRGSGHQPHTHRGAGGAPGHGGAYSPGERPRGGEESQRPTIIAESSTLAGTHIGGDIIGRLIDELPVLALAACFAQGATVIQDARELRVKESDRIRTTVEGLRSLGANHHLRLPGDAPQRRRRRARRNDHPRAPGSLRAGACLSHADHRIAMTMGVAGLLAEGETVVADAEASDISYPGFWEEAHRLEQGGNVDHR